MLAELFIFLFLLGGPLSEVPFFFFVSEFSCFPGVRVLRGEVTSSRKPSMGAESSFPSVIFSFVSSTMFSL